MRLSRWLITSDVTMASRPRFLSSPSFRLQHHDIANNIRDTFLSLKAPLSGSSLNTVPPWLWKLVNKTNRQLLSHNSDSDVNIGAISLWRTTYLPPAPPACSSPKLSATPNQNAIFVFECHPLRDNSPHSYIRRRRDPSYTLLPDSCSFFYKTVHSPFSQLKWPLCILLADWTIITMVLLIPPSLQITKLLYLSCPFLWLWSHNHFTPPAIILAHLQRMMLHTVFDPTSSFISKIEISCKLAMSPTFKIATSRGRIAMAEDVVEVLLNHGRAVMYRVENIFTQHLILCVQGDLWVLLKDALPSIQKGWYSASCVPVSLISEYRVCFVSDMKTILIVDEEHKQCARRSRHIQN